MSFRKRVIRDVFKDMHCFDSHGVVNEAFQANLWIMFLDRRHQVCGMSEVAEVMVFGEHRRMRMQLKWFMVDVIFQSLLSGRVVETKQAFWYGDVLLMQQVIGLWVARTHVMESMRRRGSIVLTTTVQKGSDSVPASPTTPLLTRGYTF